MIIKKKLWLVLINTDWGVRVESLKNITLSTTNENCTFAYIVGEEADCYTQDEDRPEDVQTLQRHQESVEEVVAKEGPVDGDWIHPGAVDDTATEEQYWLGRLSKKKKKKSDLI